MWGWDVMGVGGILGGGGGGRGGGELAWESSGPGHLGTGLEIYIVSNGQDTFVYF